MRKLLALVGAFSITAALIPGPAAAQLPPKDPAGYVDPMIGTLGGGFSFPGPAAPFGMVQLSPDTEGYFAFTGYQYADNFIRGFSHHHVQSMGVRSNGDLPFMPSVGPVVSSDPRTFMSPFSHAAEDAEAGYYKVELERGGITAELTAGERVGAHRYTFPPTPQANVIFDIGRSNVGWSPVPRMPHPDFPEDDDSGHPAELSIDPDGRIVTGTAHTRQGYDIHFAARFDRPFSGHGAWDENGATPVAGQAQASGTGAGGYVSFDTTGDREVVVEVGISFVDRDNALENLDSELPADSGTASERFDGLRASTRDRWNDALSTIAVSGGTDADKTSFYTALYHAQHHPNIYEDADGTYMGHDGAPHPSDGYTHYANFSLWDTYRGENQLLALIQPERYTDMMRSLLKIYDEAGRFPQWAMNDALPDYMEGDPVQPTVVDAYCRGLLPDDLIDEMYAALLSQARDEGGKRSDTESGYQEYHQRGYMSGRGADASGNFEYAIADFALALMADSLGRTDERDELLSRADNYRELINPDTGFAHPREADGSWMADYNEMAPDYWKEGTGWQYTWLAPQDLRGLFDLVGGNGRGGDPYVIDRLDTYFSTAAADSPAVAEMQKTITFFGVAYVGNQHAPSNEHDVHAPYLYDYIGQPYKTQKIMRGYQALFRPTPDGLPGNDDLGSMSAWFVWSALGFYPVQGGAPLYSVGSPMFESAAIDPVGPTEGPTVTASGASIVNRYIQSAALGDENLDRAWFTHDALLDAGSVTFEMGPQANEAWGADPEQAPPSISTHDLSAFGCPRREISEPETVATTLTYVGDTKARGDRIELAARLATPAASVVGETLVFEIAGQSLSAVTGSDGIARVDATIPNHGRSQQVVVRFAGNESYEPSETSATITWGGPKR